MCRPRQAPGIPFARYTFNQQFFQRRKNPTLLKHVWGKNDWKSMTIDEGQCISLKINNNL